MLSRPGTSATGDGGVTERNEAARPGCEIYGRVFRMTVHYHCMGVRKAAEERRIAPHAPPSGHVCPMGRGAGADARRNAIRASSRAGSGPPNWADRPHTARALYSVPGRRMLRARCGLFPRGGPTGYGGGLRPVGAPYGRVLGTHGRPVTGVYWWASKGGRILRAKSMVGRVAPWHDLA